MDRVRHWIEHFPDRQQAAVLEAIESSSLARIRHALRAVEELEATQRGPAFRVELLGTYSLEPLRPVLQLALNCLPSRATLEIGPLDAIETRIAQGALGAEREALDARMVLWRTEELLPEVFYPFSNGFPDGITSRRDQLLGRIEGVVRLHQQTAGGMPLFLSTVPPPVGSSNPVLAAQHRAGLFSILGSINQKLYELATENSSVYVIDLAAWASGQRRGHKAVGLDFMARQPFSAAGQVAFAFYLARFLRPLIVPRKKALAIDLDNTLWGGVLGEDGLAGLEIGPEFPGNVHLRIQRELLELKERGIALVLLSKNNATDVEEAFGSLPGMILKLEDFAVRKVNWEPKSENLRAAAAELRLGLDSFAFIDDSDYEREQMRQLNPRVLILNQNSDPLRTLNTLWETDAFDSLFLTKEDRQRQHDYRVRQEREIGANQDDLEGFLKSLEMAAIIEPIGPGNLDRVANLLAKTNQFNLTTRRHSRAEVARLANAAGSVALVLRLRDKFGEQGIIGLVIAVPGQEEQSLIIDSLLVSCRALGRGVEHALWAATVNRAYQKGVRKLQAEYVATGKNSLVADFYDKLGFRQVEGNGSVKRYELTPLAPRLYPSWINAIDEPDAA
jgi:FkbH-like protein